MMSSMILTMESGYFYQPTKPTRVFMTEADYTNHPEYDKLPEVLQQYFTPKEFAWMTDQDRTRIVEDMCYPDEHSEV